MNELQNRAVSRYKEGYRLNNAAKQGKPQTALPV
jgi:hypothetical protein